MNRLVLNIARASVMMVGTLFFVAGCADGPAENAGEKIDQGMENARETLDPSGPVENAGEKIDNAIDQ